VTVREPQDRPIATSGARIRLGCKARGWRLLPEYAFLSKSVVAGSSPGTIWINVGTATGRGVINYRTPGSGVQGACESVLQRQTEILSHVFDEWDRPGHAAGPPSGELRVTVCIDAEFKPDDAVAVFLVLHLLEHGALPRCAASMAAYMAWARRSSEPYFPAETHDGAPDGILRYLETLAATGNGALTPQVTFGFALSCRNWAKRSQYAADRHVSGSDLASVLEALVEMSREASALLERHAATRGDKPWTDFPKDANGLDPSLGSGWTESMPGDLRGELRAAAGAVLAAAESMDARTCTGRLPIGPDLRDEERVRVMVVSAGSSMASGRPKPDPHTTQLTRICIGAGLFNAKLEGPAAVLMLHGENAGWGRWFDISLTADRRHSPARSLRGLGRALEELEQERRSKTRDARRALRGRFEDIPGIVDPWYDGRDHDYGIVGGPFSGSQLTIEDVEPLLDSAYWKPRVARARAWMVVEARDGARRPMASPADGGGTNVYRRRKRQQVPTDDGALEVWSFLDDEKSRELRTRDFLLRSRDHAPPTNAALRADASWLAEAYEAPAGDSFRIVTLELCAPPFVAAERRITVADCVPELVRDQFRREFCGPVFRTVELDADSEADVGSDGMVVWRRPGAKSSDSNLGRSLGLVAMDLLAYRSDLRRLLGAASELSVLDSPAKTFVKRWWHGRSAATYLVRFVDIVKNYRPERGRQDLRRSCDALEEVLSVPSTIARLERFLQFSDERERILRDGLLQVSLLLLAIPVLFQTPADLMQAWPVWKEGGGIDSQEAAEYLVSIGKVVVSTLVVVIGGFLLLRSIVRVLPRVLRSRPRAD
jgi:hypothetical protein